MYVHRLTSDAKWDRPTPVLQRSWSDESADATREWRTEADYRLFGPFVADVGVTERPVAVAGVSIQRVLHHARVHDFVVDETHREAGYDFEHFFTWAGYLSDLSDVNSVIYDICVTDDTNSRNASIQLRNHRCPVRAKPKLEKKRQGIRLTVTGTGNS